MPITPFPTPPGPQLIGPGIFTGFSSDFIGPLPSDARWDITIQLPGHETTPWLETSIPCDGSHEGGWSPFVEVIAHPTIAIAGNEIQDGASCTMSITLMSGTSALDSGTIAGTYEATTGLPILLQDLTTGISGSFTSSDRAQLAQVAANTVVQLPINAVGGLVNAGLGRLFHEIPPSILRRHGSLHLTGNGSLSSGTEPFASYTLGIEWIFDDPPPGYGYTAGNVREYERRMVQWEPVFQTPLLETYWANLDDAHEAGQRLVWGALTPINLNYWIAPGVGLTVYFLVFNALP